MTTAITASLALACLLVVSGSAIAADRPISGHVLKIKADGTRSQIVLSSKDPALLFPGPGDDPAVGGAVIETTAGVEVQERWVGAA